MAIKQCPKCEHRRSLADGDDPARCPACGCFYAKVEAALAQQQAEEAREWKHARFTTANPRHPGNLKVPPWLGTIFVYLLYLMALWFIWLGVSQGLIEQQISWAPRRRYSRQEVLHETDGAAIIIGLCFVLFGLATAVCARVIGKRLARARASEED